MFLLAKLSGKLRRLCAAGPSYSDELKVYQIKTPGPFKDNYKVYFTIFNEHKHCVGFQCHAI